MEVPRDSTLARLESIHSTIADILSTPSLSAYSRALSRVEDEIEATIFLPDILSESEILLLRSCRVYKAHFEGAIAQLKKVASKHEHEMYERACEEKQSRTKTGANMSTDQQKNKRRGVLFDVDKGDHILAALEALRLEEFLEERRQDQKKVRFS